MCKTIKIINIYENNQKLKLRKPKPHLNGWFMITDPSNGRILSVEVMSEPENNAVKIAAIEKILHIYPNVDLFIHDVNCKLAPSI